MTLSVLLFDMSSSWQGESDQKWQWIKNQHPQQKIYQKSYWNISL